MYKKKAEETILLRVTETDLKNKGKLTISFISYKARAQKNFIMLLC